MKVDDGLLSAAEKLRDWLLYTGRFIESFEEFVQALGVALQTFGYEVERLNLGVYILHPEIAGVAFQWSRETAGLVMVPVQHDDLESPTYLQSPIRAVVANRQELYLNLGNPSEGSEFPVIDEFRDIGITGYAALPLAGGSGRMNVWSVATKKPGGFGEEEWLGLQSFSHYLSLVVDYLAVQWLSGVLMQVYLGQRTGQRVLNGQVKRGDGHRIHAALWYCDMRGFTELSSQLSSDRLIAVLNDYFGKLGPAVQNHQGEILKFIGDAMLAIFPVDSGVDGPAEACERAYLAARQAVEAVDRWSTERSMVGESVIQCGIALHIGEVVYGNIGTPGRLDFTVIGEAVNRVARVESLCAPLHASLLATEEFVEAIGSDAEPVGKHNFKGIDGPVGVYKLG